MKPESGQYVKCFLRNSNVLEGIVETWGDTEVVLKSLDGENFLIVHRPADDIILTKVMLIDPSKISEDKNQHVPEVKEKIVQKLHQMVEQPDNDSELQKKSIAELRAMVLEQERQIINQKRREHFSPQSASSRYRPTVDTVMQLKKYKTPMPRSAYVPGKLPPWVK